jgi:hypothetical protein
MPASSSFSQRRGRRALAAFAFCSLVCLMAHAASAQNKKSTTKQPDKTTPKTAREPKWLPLRELLVDSIQIEYKTLPAATPKAGSKVADGAVKKRTVVCVRAIFPRDEQIAEIADALPGLGGEAVDTDAPRQFAEEAFEILDFEIERQEAISQAKPPVWEKQPWKKVSIEKSIDMLTETTVDEDDFVRATEASPMMTSPLPVLAKGKWDHRVTHPRLKDNRPPDKKGKDRDKDEVGLKREESTDKYLLLRYFDVDVEPGRLYRYRIRLTNLNPAFAENDVPPEVSEGEQRQSPWSDPSPVVTVAKSPK